MLPDDLAALAERVDTAYLRRRLEMEAAHEAHAQRRNGLTHLENWRLVRVLIQSGLSVAGLHGRGLRNALKIAVAHHRVPVPRLPRAFHGYTILHLSDLHLDGASAALDPLIETIRPLDYDLCVLTGDYRFRTYGPWDDALAGLRRLRDALRTPAYAVLGNHDSIRMVPAMEAMGYRLLLNEHLPIRHSGDTLHLAGVEDTYLYGLADLPRAAREIPPDAPSILLSHTPEIYHHAAETGFDLMLCGHTHGGQICLPGGLPLITHADCPRRLVRGSWRYGEMTGYTSRGAGNSLVHIRFNCPPEVTLHRLERADA